MIATLLLAVQLPPAAPAMTAAPVPTVGDWSTLPLFPLPRAAAVPEGTRFVRSEVEAARCRAITPMPADRTRVIVPVAILVGEGGITRRIVPRAIGCPAVEQYTVGYLSSLTRAGPGSLRPPAPGWYRFAVTYRW